MRFETASDAVSFICAGSSVTALNRRYVITDYIDDLRTLKNPEEMFATLAKLYETLADFYLRANRHWSAQGKAIPRAFKKVDAKFAKEYSDAFSECIVSRSSQQVILLTEKILKPYGGTLFDGDRRVAPSNWRSKV